MVSGSRCCCRVAQSTAGLNHVIRHPPFESLNSTSKVVTWPLPFALSTIPSLNAAQGSEDQHGSPVAERCLPRSRNPLETSQSR
jgi:hypothetical protein